MKTIITVIALALLTTTFAYARGAKWHATVKKSYRNALGDNEVNVSIRLVSCSGRSAILDVELCGQPAKGSAVCTELDTGKRMKPGQSVGMWVKLPRTRYPIERVFVRD